MTAEERAKLARLLGDATQTPWTLDPDAGVMGAPYERNGLVMARSLFFTADYPEDEELIVAAVNALPALLADSAELERLRGVVEQVRVKAHMPHPPIPRMSASWRDGWDNAMAYALAILDGRADDE